jgi:hypothetical protein
MSNLRSWPLWARVLVAALVLYSAILCAVSLTTFIQTLRQHWTLKASDIVLQSLMTLFLPALLVGLRSERLASRSLFAGVAIDLALLCFLSRAGNGTAVGIVTTLIFVGCPMLGAAILFRRLSRPAIERSKPAPTFKL